jgi:GT2 family glycosyltransferase
MPRGTVIIVAHNSAEHIGHCLEALCRQTGWQNILIDNASTDKTVQKARAFADKVQIVAEHQNRGFAGAVNHALSMTTSSVVVVLNPDAVPRAAALDQLAAAVTNLQVGAAGGLLLDEQGKPQRGFIMRRFPSLGSMLCETLLLNRVWPRNPSNRRYRYLDADYACAQVVDQPAGAALAFRREVWQAVGGFDEQFYPVWFEDVDFCRRLQKEGWNLLYEPNAIFSHAGAHSVGQLSYSDRQLFWYRNLLRYFRKHHRRLQCLILRAAIALGMGIRYAAAGFGLRPKSVQSCEARRAYAQVLSKCVFSDFEAKLSTDGAG